MNPFESDSWIRRLVIIFSVISLVASGVLLYFKINVFTHVNTGVILLAVTIAYVFRSIRICKASEVGVILLWGEAIKDAEVGLNFVPWLMCKMLIAPGTLVQHEYPTEPKRIFRGDGPVPSGMLPPTRIVFGSPLQKGETREFIGIKGQTLKIEYNPDFDGHAYNKMGMMTEVQAVLAKKMQSYLLYYKNFGEYQTDQDNFDQTISAMFDRCLLKAFKGLTPIYVLNNLDIVSQALYVAVKEEFPFIIYGVGFEEVYVKGLTFSHELNKSVESVTEAAEAAKATKAEAEGKAAAMITEAKGKAEAITIEAKAEKEAFILKGLAKVDSAGNIVELVPEANVRVRAEAVKELAKLAETKGTVVLGASVMLGLKEGGGGK